jgi:acetyl-CoA carboxylase biotin carboxylase subunit
MNTRIQDEHPVTEAVTGIDLVRQQLLIAAGEPLRIAQSDVRLSGHAIECRITAELPRENFRPNPGRISRWQPPEGEWVRLDSHCYEGYVVPIYYDSLLGKLIVHGRDRAEAIALMQRALAAFVVDGIGTTIPFLAHAMADAEFRAGRVNTQLVAGMIDAMLAPAP